MKLRVTKGRITVAVVLAPLLYVLNVGPMIFCTVRFGFPPDSVLQAMYQPLHKALGGTPLQSRFESYVDWWENLGYRGS